MWRSGSAGGRARALVAPLVVVLALVAGCATVPTSGPVEHHTPQATGVNSGVQVDPLPPADGASQLLVVEGFLHAMGTYQPNYAVARQYLTAAASQVWHPESGVQVYADGFPPTETETSVVLSVRITGKVNAAGSYSPVGNEAPPLRHDFGLTKNEAGQWRINTPPDGLLVSRYQFTTGFVAVNLHFEDPAGSVLVPDPRFFADGDQALATALRAQLAGPSAWLAPAVRKVDTSGVTVTGVDVDSDGTATVELGGTASRFSADERRVILAELAYTASGFTRVSTIRVSVDGEAWRDDNGQATVSPDSFGQLSATGTAPQRALFIVKDHKVQRLRDVTSSGELADVDVGLVRPEKVAVNHDLSEVAATSEGGTRLQVGRVGTDKVTTPRVGTGLLRPEYARNGELWSPAAGGLRDLQVFKGDQRLKVRAGSAPVPDLPMRALALSPDGTRLALIVAHGRQTQVGLARVQREDGQVTVGGWHPLDLSLVTGNAGQALELGWVSETELVVLQASEEGTSVVRVSQDGATSTDIGPSETADLTRLAVAPLRPVIALGRNGTVYRRDGEFNWNPVVASVDSVAYSD